MPEELVKDVNPTDEVVVPESSPETLEVVAEVTPVEPEEKKGPTGWVPKMRLDEVIAERNAKDEQLQREREERIRVEERLRAEAEVKKQQAPRRYSWAELEKMVEDGHANRQQVEAYKEESFTLRMTEQAEQIYSRKQVESAVEATVAGELTGYRELLPSLNSTASPERIKAEQEYARLVSVVRASGVEPPRQGTKAQALLEAQALRSAFGPLDRLREVRSAADKTRERRPTHQEVGADGGGGMLDTQPAKGKDPVADLTPREKEHYQRMIRSGRYSGWDAVRTEIKEYNKIKGIK